MEVAVRRVYRRGKTLTLSLPRRWRVPDVLNVYASNRVGVVIYTSYKGLDSMLKVRYVATVRRSRLWYGGSYVYLVSIPAQVAKAVGISRGDEVLVISTAIADVPLIVCLKNIELIADTVLDILAGRAY